LFFLSFSDFLKIGKAPKPPWVTTDGSLRTVLLSTYGDTTLRQLSLLTDTFPRPRRPPSITLDEAPGTVLLPNCSATSPRPLRRPWITADEAPSAVLLVAMDLLQPSPAVGMAGLSTPHLVWCWTRPPAPPWITADESPGGVLLSTYGDATIPQLSLLTDTFPRPPRPPWLPVGEAPAPCGCPPTLPPLRVCPGCGHGRGPTTDGARMDQDGDSLIWFMC
jgi:hypothetical protein